MNKTNEEEKRAQAAEMFYTISAQTGYTFKEMAEAIALLAPFMNEVWNTVTQNESLWRQREDLYRQTFILGRFHWYRRLRVWNIRRKI